MSAILPSEEEKKINQGLVFFQAQPATHLFPLEFAVHFFSLSPVLNLALHRKNVVERNEDRPVDRMCLGTIGIALVAVGAEPSELSWRGGGHAAESYPGC